MTKKKVRAVFAADFEATTDPNDCRVWAWGAVNVDNLDELVIDHTLPQFIDFISGVDSKTYFHNLKYDGGFILDYLLNNGFEENHGRGRLGAKQFRTLISHMNKFYSITVRWDNGNTTEFRDSAKKFPGQSIARLAKTFKMEASKGDIDYHAERPVGYSMTAAERDYVARDVKILATALAITINNGATRLTVGSDALAEYRDIMGQRFDRYFPALSLAMDAELRKSYRGGFTYRDPRFAMKVTGAGIVLDVNSLYPSVMLNNWLPHGLPEYFMGEPVFDAKRPLTIFSATITARLKANHIPCIQIKNNSAFVATEYLTEITEPTTLVMTNVDWQLYKDHYDIDVLSWGGGWTFKAAKGMFTEFVDKWREVKENSEGGVRELAKYNLNNLYGKFCTNPLVRSKHPVLDEGVVKYKPLPDEYRNPVYTPVGIFITSYGRDITIRAGQANYDVFAYADTDSLHLLTTEIPANLEVHKTKFGAWSLEHRFIDALFIRPKAYLERLGGDKHCSDDECMTAYGSADGHCLKRHDMANAFAGLPDRVSARLGYADIYEGAEFTGKLVPRTVAGGVVLKDVPYRLKL